MKKIQLTILVIILSLSNLIGQTKEEYQIKFENGKNWLQSKNYIMAMSEFLPLTSRNEQNPFDTYASYYYSIAALKVKKFQEATNCILKQFSQYRVNNSPLQGGLVVGEATADLGGLTLAYRAFRQSDAYKQAKTIQGFTPDQQFFLGAAHVWASNIRPELAQQLLTTDPHPPNRYRVNGTLANMPAFQAAFGIPSKSPMVNVDRCVIW